MKPLTEFRDANRPISGIALQADLVYIYPQKKPIDHEQISALIDFHFHFCMIAAALYGRRLSYRYFNLISRLDCESIDKIDQLYLLRKCDQDVNIVAQY